MTRDEVFNIIKTKADDMRHSKILTDHFRHFFADNKDVDTFAQWMKKIAMCPTKPGVSLSFEDPNYSRAVVDDETKSFYYTLDQMTGGKHQLLRKIEEQEKYTTYSTTQRSSCSITGKRGFLGKEQLVKKIIIDEQPKVNNRTAKMHEFWHAIHEKNYTLQRTNYSNQFFGEIGTMAIDFMGAEFIKSLHPEDKQLCDQLSYLQNEAKFNDNVFKAREGYVDYILGKILVGTPQEQEFYLNELVDGWEKYWGPRTLDGKLHQIDAFVRDPNNNHYDPMYECRYVPASAIVFELRKSNASMAEKVDKIATLNENLLSINNLAKDGETNGWNIITSHLGIPNIEQTMDNLANTIIKENLPITHQQHSQNSSPMLP